MITFQFRLSRVCRLWWRVSSCPLLWHTVDLATGRVKEKHRTERKLFWLLEYRLPRVQDLALGKSLSIVPIHVNIHSFGCAGGWNSALSRAAIEALSTTCRDLKALSLTGCKGLTGDSLLTIIQNCKSLERLDLSAVSVIKFVCSAFMFRFCGNVITSYTAFNNFTLIAETLQIFFRFNRN